MQMNTSPIKKLFDYNIFSSLLPPCRARRASKNLWTISAGTTLLFHTYSISIFLKLWFDGIFDAAFWLFNNIFWSYDLMIFFDCIFCINLASFGFFAFCWLCNTGLQKWGHTVYCRGTRHRISTIIRSIIKKTEMRKANGVWKILSFWYRWISI